MPANLTPEFKKAEELLREARTTEEKITALELMLSTIPKHKGTDHMQADIKRRLAKLRSAPEGKGTGRHGDVFHVPKGTAAGQVVLLGTPNSGKSALVAQLTNAPVQVAQFPFSTHAPVPGIMRFEDIQIQLVDMPPITRDHVEPGQTNTYRQCHLILVVVDLAAADVTEQMDTCLAFLWERTLIPPPGQDLDEELIRRLVRPCLCVASKCDLANEADADALRDLYGDRLEIVAASARQADSLGRLSLRIFQRLQIVRIYSKLPGKKPQMEEPFVLPVGATVEDLAAKVHRDLAGKLRFARAWGRDKYDGQPIPRNYPLQDQDIVELHFG
ncbi:MAG: 50S ribosome-binding GTPase [Sedimentisphaerales bacterium]|nr:50S ribosome-binding GTPase [Sedimentisphaerales bacterium]